MDNFKIIYRILKYLEQCMDYAGFDIRPISHTSLGITRERWEIILIGLQTSGLIRGVITTQTLGDVGEHIVSNPTIHITLSGLEWLELHE